MSIWNERISPAAQWHRCPVYGKKDPSWESLRETSFLDCDNCPSSTGVHRTSKRINSTDRQTSSKESTQKTANPIRPSIPVSQNPPRMSRSGHYHSRWSPDQFPPCHVNLADLENLSIRSRKRGHLSTLIPPLTLAVMTNQRLVVHQEHQQLFHLILPGSSRYKKRR